MKLLHSSLLLLSALAGTSLAEFSYTITAKKHGVPVPPSDILLSSYPPSVHRLGGHKRQGGGHRSLRKRNTYATSGDWCGAVANTPSTNKFTSASGYFQVPTIAVRTGLSTPQYLSAWVGIDGYTHTTSLLQAGISSAISSSGTQQNWAWFEWVPAAAYNIPNFPVATGDWMHAIITVVNATKGIVYLENYTQSYSVNVTLTGGTTLGQVDADWIVEDPFSTGGSQVPFPTFTDVWFEQTDSTTVNGTHKGINSALMLNMEPGTFYTCKSFVYDNADFYAHSQP